MDNQELQKFIGLDTLNVSEAMQKIDNNSNGILFLVNDISSLVGCITDGDIRRFLLAGGKMTDPAVKAANSHPRTASSLEEAKHLYHNRDFVVIPIVDENGKIIDLYTGKTEETLFKVLPKPLIPVGDLPIIELIMKEYESYACDEFHIIVNYKRGLMKAYFADNERKYNITWHDEEEPLGTGGGLRLLRGKIDSTFFFANCDALLTANYESIMKFHKENNNVITMICAYKNINIPYGVVDMGVNGTIENMKEKPLISFLTNTGIYIVEPEVIDDIADDEVIGFPDIVEREKQKGKKVAVFPISENDWMDMGQFPELEKMRIKLYGE